MGQSTAETVKEIEQTRDRIETNLHELEERLPKPVLVAKKVAIGGGVGTTVALFAIRRALKRRRRARAADVAAVPVTAVVNLLPDRWVEKLDDERVKAWGAGFAAAWVLMRSLELRQLRALRRAVVAGR